MARAHETDDFYKRMVKAMIQELGGSSEAAKKLERNHGLSPLRIAIEILGGEAGAARILGVSRQRVHQLVEMGPDEMKGSHLRKISEITRIPIETLMLSGPGGALRKASHKTKQG